MNESHMTHGAFSRRKLDIGFADFKNPWNFAILFLSPHKDVTYWLMNNRNHEITIHKNSFFLKEVNLVFLISCNLKWHFWRTHYWEVR